MTDKYLILVPFTGFYESDHDELLSDELVQMLVDDHGDLDPDLGAEFWNRYGYTSKLLYRYSEEYLEDLAAFIEGETGVQLTLEYESLDSPREYNFTTDRLFATTDARTICTLALGTNPVVLSTLVRERFTSRSGFISYYPSDLAEWPSSPLDWDHNQLGTLLQAWLGDQGVEIPLAWELLESARDNGEIDSLLYEEMPAECRAIVDRLSEARH